MTPKITRQRDNQALHPSHGPGEGPGPSGVPSGGLAARPQGLQAEDRNVPRGIRSPRPPEPTWWGTERTQRLAGYPESQWGKL